jgi:hypothetical protein
VAGDCCTDVISGSLVRALPVSRMGAAAAGADAASAVTSAIVVVILPFVR